MPSLRRNQAAAPHPECQQRGINLSHALRRLPSLCPCPAARGGVGAVAVGCTCGGKQAGASSRAMGGTSNSCKVGDSNPYSHT